MLEKRLNQQRDRLQGLAKLVTKYRRVVDAAKCYVLTPYVDDKVDARLHIELADAVHALIKDDAPRPQNGRMPAKTD